MKKKIQEGARLERSRWLTDFLPRRWMRNSDIQTLAANFLPRHVDLPQAENVEVIVDATGSRVLCHCNWQPETVRGERMTMLLVHGLEGSSNSQYMLGNADKAWRAGWNVIRMNMRNCCGTEELSTTLYHSGLSADVHAVSQFFVARNGLRKMAWIGYSMGGNMVLKAAGEYGSSAPAWLRAVVGVSPLIDMSASADALHEPRNRIYEWNFLKNMLRRYRRKTELFPGEFQRVDFNMVRSIRQYDEQIVAPNCGFTGASDYYNQSAAAGLIDKIAIPTLLLHALDDPFIRLLPETRMKIAANPNITFVEPAHGGHCGFLSPPGVDLNGYRDGYWAESTLMGFIQSVEESSAPQQGEGS